MEIFETVRTFVVTLIVAVIAYLKPIEGEEEVLFLVFIINFIAGYLCDILANGERFRLKKAMRCVGEASMFFTLCAAVFFIGNEKHNTAGALQCVSFITYTVIYFYAINVLRNLKNILKPDTAAHKTIAFLYYVVSVEFIKHVPYLDNFIKIKTKIK